MKHLGLCSFLVTACFNNIQLTLAFLKEIWVAKLIGTVWPVRNKHSAGPLYKLHFQTVVSSICYTCVHVWSSMQKFQDIRGTELCLFCLAGKGASRSKGQAMLMAMNSVSSLQYAVLYVLRKQPLVTHQSCKSMTPAWPLFMNSWLKAKVRAR